MMYAIANINTGEIVHCSQVLHMAAIAYVSGTCHAKGRTQFEAESRAKNVAYDLKRDIEKTRQKIVLAEKKMKRNPADDGPPETTKV